MNTDSVGTLLVRSIFGPKNPMFSGGYNAIYAFDIGSDKELKPLADNYLIRVRRRNFEGMDSNEPKSATKAFTPLQGLPLKADFREKLLHSTSLMPPALLYARADRIAQGLLSSQEDGEVSIEIVPKQHGEEVSRIIPEVQWFSQGNRRFKGYFDPIMKEAPDSLVSFAEDCIALMQQGVKMDFNTANLFFYKKDRHTIPEIRLIDQIQDDEIKGLSQQAQQPVTKESLLKAIFKPAGSGMLADAMQNIGDLIERAYGDKADEVTGKFKKALSDAFDIVMQKQSRLGFKNVSETSAQAITSGAPARALLDALQKINRDIQI